MGRFEMPSLKRICAAQTSALSTLRVGPSNPAVERTAHQRRWRLSLSASPLGRR
jgi:hypothetical protein